MTTRLAKTNRGFNFIEVVAILGVIWVGVFLLLPVLRPARAHGNPITCVNNLKQAALATIIWSHDNEGGFPWQVSTTRTDLLSNASGTLDWISSPEVFRHFRILSNELVTPKVLICPTDKQRFIHDDTATVTNNNLSYFVNVAAQITNTPSAVLFGDRSITGGLLSNGFMRSYSSAREMRWTEDVHQSIGNIAFVDGSARQMSNGRLDDVASEVTAVRLAIP
jgi:prepilin-type processing-associated H-X9-DG protein